MRFELENRAVRTSRMGRVVSGAIAVVSALALIASLAGCGAGRNDPPAVAAQSDPSAPEQYQLAAVCPANVVVQMSWKPQAEYGAIWNLLGDDYKIDSVHKETAATLTTSDGYKTGVTLTIRNVPSAQSAETIGYINQDTLLTFLDTDKAIAAYAAGPQYTAVVAPMKTSPYMVMWDPATYPNAKSLKDLSAQNATVLANPGTTWPAFLESKGVIKASEVDSSYTGDPARFVSDPKVSQQGMSTSEPYQYEHEIGNWDKPVAYDLLSNYGFNVYPQPYAVRTADLEMDTPCLSKLVPIIQRSIVNYAKDGSRALDRIVKAAEAYNDGWVYSQGLAEYGWKTMSEQHIVGDEDGVAGGIDMGRVQDVIDTFSPLVGGTGLEVPQGLKATDLATDRFLDPSITFADDGK